MKCNAGNDIISITLKSIWNSIGITNTGYGTTNTGYGTTNTDAGVGIGMKRGDSKICLKRLLISR